MRAERYQDFTVGAPSEHAVKPRSITRSPRSPPAFTCTCVNVSHGCLLFTNARSSPISLEHGLASTRRAGSARSRPDCHRHCDLAPRAPSPSARQITDVRVLDNQRTEESTVRSIAGVSIGDTLEADTLDMVRERLNTTGLFADVNVWWEPHGSGVRVNISVKDKFPWAPVPTASWSANNKSIGLLFVHGNLFGRGKQLAARRPPGARSTRAPSLAYRDPSLFGTWIYWQLQGLVQRQVIPEYQNSGMTPTGVATLADPFEFRETRLFSYGFEPAFGVAWLRRVKTQVAWHLEKFSYFGTGAIRSIRRNDRVGPPVGRQRRTRSSDQGRHLGVGRADADLRLSRARVRRDDRRGAQRRPRLRAAPPSAATSPTGARGVELGAGHQVLPVAQPHLLARARPPVTTCRSGPRTPPADPTCAATSTSSFAATRSSAARSSTTSRSSRSARSTFARSASTTCRPSGSGTCPTARRR